jgi:ABC-type uncharacterized transport system substrate-binding protein
VHKVFIYPIVKTCLFFIAALIFVCLSHRGFSHPHVFVDAELTIVFDEKGLAGFRQRWLFDEMFSSTMLSNFDKNEDHVLDAHEIGEIKKGGFGNLRNYGYFTHILIDGDIFEVTYVMEFSAEVHDNRLLYTFFVPCHVIAGDQFTHVTISVFDETYYTDVALLPESLSCEGGSTFVVTYEITRVKEFSYYYGQMTPDGVSIQFKRNNA